MNKLLYATAAVALTACGVETSTAAPETGAQASKTAPGHQSDGLVRIASAYSVDETVARLEAALAERNVTVMVKIDHSANAAGAELTLGPTVLIIFGNPAAGTQLMAASRSAGIDLPMKALVYEENGAVMLEYNAIEHIAVRHALPADMPVLPKIKGLLAAVAAEATGVQ